jgi:hypothetical protein
MLRRARPLTAPVVADSVCAPPVLYRARPLGAPIVAGSVFVAPLVEIDVFQAMIQANSAFAIAGLDIYRLPKPNVPQPLPPNPNKALRIVPNNPGPPQLGIGTTTSTRRRGL